VFGHTPRLAHSHQGDHPHPLRRQAWITISVATLLAVIALLLPPHAHGNFVYWTNENQTTIGRAKINGTGANDNFITGLNDPIGVAVDSNFIYWAERGNDSIGRANLDGTGVNRNFIPSSAGVNNPAGVAVTPNAIFWGNNSNAIGRANLDGTGPVASFINITQGAQCGLAADSNFVYWTDTINPSDTIGRAPVGGGTPEPGFISGISAECGVAVDPSFIYWATEAPNTSIGRAAIGGTGATNDFIPSAATPQPCGVAVNSQYVFWGNESAKQIGRANINGSAPNPSLIAGVATAPCLLAAAPSNKITVNSIAKKKKKGTATINAKVPGPGQVTLNQTNTPPDVNATAAAVKQVGLTVTQASSFSLPVKPQGKTAKKLNKGVKKKGKGKAKVKVFIHFVPAGVAGVPNTQPVTITLIKQGKKKK
jgi:Low-density lipoprotein receptor repeat class B